MASLNISLVFKLLFFAVLLIASTVSATDNIPSFHKPHIRKLSMEYRSVGKAGGLGAKPAFYDFPWKGGYDPPNNNR